ncbi:citrate transporter [Deferribacter desulfuricans SSM1]|uniref:Citrate transporter n=1 Tax=Deferribacter desulfuricans (strain DSM 14783 / JCM 11476 / NBRC 101012 / SSM1) TaxID=639282 RepID=D3PDH6_DEFDS|nr:anion transporter [Deferribacter desulfuricans]BAI80649.1 citrate transporter [Deferribacter desulfuricans SSM1]
MLPKIILAFTLVAIGIGYFPKFRMNRTTIALVGATFLIITGGISYKSALKSINLDTLVLLFSMMIVNAHFVISGFSELITHKIIKYANTPKKLLFIIIFSSGLLSAILLNDTIVIMFTPITISILISLKRNPIPYLLGLGMAANIGSAITPVGNPQNMLIASYSGLKFLDFVIPLFIVSIISLFILYFTLLLFFRKEFTEREIIHQYIPNFKIYKPVLLKFILTTIVMFILFLFRYPVSYSALIAASIFLFTRRIKPEKIFQKIDWSLLVLFSSLFVITSSVETTGISKTIYLLYNKYMFTNMYLFSFSIAILSNIVSNVPAVMLFAPFIKSIGNSHEYWITAAMASTFAGNLTILGSIANIIVLEIALKKGIKITFMQFFKIGIVVTIITLLVGIAWLDLIF